MLPRLHSRSSGLLSLLLISSAAFAQNSNKENSPLSRYGIGDLRTGTNAVNRGMGYASTAYNSPTAVNTDNPASYSFLKSATYEAAGEGTLKTIRTDNGASVYRTGSATLSYLNIGIPVGKHGGLAFGLRPQSRVYYNLVDTISAMGLGKTAREFTGDGGLNYVFLGGSYRIGDFSFGANGGYMFGTIQNSSRLYYLDTLRGTVNADFSSYRKIGGLYFKGGMQYRAVLSKKIFMSIGATAAVGQHIGAKADNYRIGFNYVNGVAINDTSEATLSKKGEVKLPGTYSAGIQFGGLSWLAALDVQTTNWGGYSSYGAKDSLIDNALRIGLGGEFTPDATSRGYLQRVTYRLGFFYGNDHVMLRDTKQNFYGLTFGGSLPFKQGVSSRIHIAMEIGRRGTYTAGLIRENYFRTTLGISLNDKSWFIKRKYD